MVRLSKNIHVLSLKEYKTIWSEITKWQRKNKKSRLPNYIDIYGLRISKTQLLSMYNRMKTWRKNHNNNYASEIGIEGAVPSENIAPVYKDTCMRSPRWLDDDEIAQNTNYFCACNISQQVLFELFNIVIPEEELAVHEGTTKQGTDHEGIKSGIELEAYEHGHEVRVWFDYFRNIGFEQVGKFVKNPRIGLFFHDVYKLKWGHYEYPVGVCMDNETIIIANSLSGGYIENRSFDTMLSYINAESQASVGIVQLIK